MQRRLLQPLLPVALLATWFVSALPACEDDASGAAGSGGSSVPDGGTSGAAGTAGGGWFGSPRCDEPPAGARVWHVDGAIGDDANDGRSYQTPFRTIGRALDGDDAPIEPGDAVLIHAGRYRERLRIRRGGTAEQRVLVRPYADEQVLIDASDPVDGWELESGAIYRAPCAFAARAVVIDDTLLVPEASVGSLQEGRFYYDAPAETLHVWAPGGVPPAEHDVGVLWADDDKLAHGVYLELASYVTLCGLTIRFAPDKGVKILGDYDRVEQCRVLYNMGIGISVGPWESTLSTDNAIVGNEIAYNFLRNWPRCLYFAGGDYKSGGWGTGASSQNAPNTRFERNLCHHNGGEGLVSYGGTAGSSFVDNVVFDNWSVNIYVLNQQNARIENNLVYAHTPDLSELTNNGDPDPSDGRCAKTLRPFGIATGDEGGLGSSSSTGLGNVRIVNNMAVGCRAGFTHVHETDESGLREVAFLFNTVVLPAAPLPGESPAGLVLPYNDGNNSGSQFRNNLVVGSCEGCPLLQGSVPAGVPDPFAGLAIDHNLLFHPSNPTSLYWGDSWEDTFDHAAWVALGGTSHGEGDVLADPQLGDATSLEAAALCPRALGSPALDAAVDVGVGEDFFHQPRPVGGGFDVGACEPR